MSHNLMNTDLEAKTFPIKKKFFSLNIFVKENKRERLYINIITRHLIKKFIIADVTISAPHTSFNFIFNACTKIMCNVTRPAHSSR